MQKIRAFVAIELPPELTGALSTLQQGLKQKLLSLGGDAGIKWARPEATHLTIRFLGSIDEDLIDDISGELDTVCSQTPSLEITVEGVGGFPSLESPRVVWAGIKDNEALSVLHEKLEDALEGLGFERETRPFRAHLTLCRIKDKSAAQRFGEAAAEGFETGINHSFIAGEIVLYKSELRAAGAVYTALKRSALKANASRGD